MLQSGASVHCCAFTVKYQGLKVSATAQKQPRWPPYQLQWCHTKQQGLQQCTAPHKHYPEVLSSKRASVLPGESLTERQACNVSSITIT
jgi:hypothetical protein